MNDLSSNEDDGEEKEENIVDKSATKKIKLTSDKIFKFESLKQKRLDLKLKQERNQLKKQYEKKYNKSKQVTINNNDDNDYDLRIDNNKRKTLNAFSDEVTQLRIKQLEAVKTIKSKRFDSAQQLTNKYASEQNNQNQTNQLNNSNKNSKKILNWTFNPKQRWETKSNM